jgi:tight adherence protein C
MQVFAAHLSSLGGFVEANSMPLIVASMFGFVFLALLAVMQAAQARQAVRRRAVAYNPASAARSTPGPAAAAGVGDDASDLLYSVDKGLSAAGTAGVSKVRGDLIRAGYFGKDAVAWYYVARFAAGGLQALASFTVIQKLAPETSAVGVLAWTAAAACSGMMLPSLIVSRRQKIMVQQCRSGFPNFLDLLVVCSEAGLTPRAGIERVSRELTVTHPFLGANLFLMCLELRAGRPLVEAVQSLGKRVRIDEIRSLGSLLQQTEELGTNLSSSLRVYSDEMRSRRLLQAEERAHALPVKLVLPLALFVFPVMLIVALLPLFIRIHKAFF